MIENAPIVKDMRKIRETISEKFDNDIDRYIDYLVSEKRKIRAQKPTIKGADSESVEFRDNP